MSTVDKEFAERLIDGGGWLKEFPDHDAPDNPPAVRITKYTNAWGGEAYGVVFEGEGDVNRYSRPTAFIRNPVIIWEKKGA